MIELQTAVGTMMALILAGGTDAAKELIKDKVLNGAKEVSAAWHALFLHEPDAYPLADRVASHPDDSALAAELRELLERVLSEHPELLPAAAIQVRTGDIKAESGSVAAAVIQGSPITITNSK